MAHDSTRLVFDARTLSDGTLATLTGLNRYDQLGAIQLAFVQFCQAHPEFVRWQDAWQEFAKTTPGVNLTPGLDHK